MKIERPLAHDETVQRLWRAASRERLPHALVFEGPRGVGRFLAAMWFAAGLLCAEGPGEPCGSCGPCKRIGSGGARGNHPDLLRVDPIEEGEERIRVAWIARRDDAGGGDERESVEDFLSLRSLEGPRRVVLVRESHRMNAFAQNALLKTLEEPRPGTLLLLETHRPGLLLPTLKSRCVRIRFGPLPREDCARVLSGAGVAPDEAELLARWSGGAPGLALDLRQRGAPALLEILADLGLRRRGPLEAALAVWDVEGTFPGTTPLASARERVRAFLDLALDVLRDVLRVDAGLDPSGLPQGELAREIRSGVETSRARVEATLDAVLEARADVERNLTPASIVDRACLVLAGQVPIITAAGR